ncbi:M10 family metallopeptidase C-terminal domain-containing protein [Paracoccus denitrificans]|nr:M10 family metallopeptidase C-terminal domain-containing protein [Paracoccus denitrificans]
MFGDAGDDLLGGGDGHDLIEGGDGNDTLVGGRGCDTLVGGLGADVFVFSAPEDLDGSTDVILDFTSGEDKIDLSGLGLTSIGTDDFSSSDIVISVLGPDFFVVFVDLDSDRRADLVLEVSGSAGLFASDFLL